MRRNNNIKIKAALTIVELIIVITIIIILSTISFISFKGYSKDARDSVRITEIKDLLGLINLENSKGVHYSKLIKSYTGVNVTINGNNAKSKMGIVDFNNLGENEIAFKDPSNNHNYPIAYSIGGVGTGSYKFIQIATINERKNFARVIGTYYEVKPGDSPSIIKKGGTFIEDGKRPLPYELDDIEDDKIDD